MTLETVLMAVSKEDVERSEKMVRTAADIAGPAEATVALTHIYKEEEYDNIRDELGFERDSEVTPTIVAERYVPIKEIRAELESEDVTCEIHGSLGEGSIGGRIVEIAAEVEADLVIVGGRKRSPAGKAAFGSIAQKVLLNAHCPVTFVRSN
jgi:nucleotide-binding universal stress UspA family protein